MTNHEFRSFAVAGAGAWGTALACILAQEGHPVTLWARRADAARRMEEKRVNEEHLPGITLPASVHVTPEREALCEADALFIAVPAQPLRGFCEELARTGFSEKIPLVLCAKGIERESLALPSVIVAETLPGHPLAVLSGPNFAHEIAAGLPAATTLAAPDPSLGKALAVGLRTPFFRPYVSTDIIGAQVGGAVKNVLAIACGIVAGRRLGENARAALVARGLAEMSRLGLALGGQAETMMGLAGLGDLVLTCSSLSSRNMSLGFALGEGQKLESILATRKSVSEGVFSASATVALANRHGVDMPIASAVHAILDQDADLDATIAGLLNRPLKMEE